MARHTTPEFGIAVTATSDDETRARATRLALFFNTISLGPEVAQPLFEKYVSCSALTAKLDQEPYKTIAEGEIDVADLEGLEYGQQVELLTGLIIKHQDDIEADVDRETAEAIRRDLISRRREDKPFDQRLARLSVVLTQLVALDLSSVPITQGAGIYSAGYPHGAFPEAGAA